MLTSRSYLATQAGPARPSEIRLVTRLERDGLARREPDPADGRAVVVAALPALDRLGDLLG